MPLFDLPVTEIIRQRYTCRSYLNIPMTAVQARQVDAFVRSIQSGPLGTLLRFELAAALDQDSQTLKGLGTYGLIKNPPGFIIGAAGKGPKSLEDYGYGLETIILFATSLGLGTCWLGGNFTKSSFSKKIKIVRGETLPGVAVIGYAVDGIRARDPLRQKVKSDTRKPWHALFFQSNFETPLTATDAGEYATPLEMLRLAPSSHNYQPWRVIRDGSGYHFYLQRTPGFGPGSLMFTLLRVSDLQRVEMGIAMCHFELAARELGLAGKWKVLEPPLPRPSDLTEYVVTWVGE